MEIIILIAIAFFLFYRLKKISARLNAVEKELLSLKLRVSNMQRDSSTPEAAPDMLGTSTSDGDAEKMQAALQPTIRGTPLPPKPEIPRASPLPSTPAVPPVVDGQLRTATEQDTPKSLPVEKPVVASVEFAPAKPSKPQMTPPHAPPVSEEMKKRAVALFDMEEMLGTNWLLKIGMALVVVGLALFLGYSLQQMGPYGKVFVGLFVSAGTILGGWSAERRKRYEIFGRVLQSGGWALAYFTTYAMHYIEATKILDSGTAAFTLMMLVAAGMIAHSLYYRSQFVTGFAFGLGYLVMVINPVAWYTLLASMLLTLSIVLILWRLGWYEMEIFAIIGTYGIHFLWLYQIISPMGAVKKDFPDFYASAALLITYWLVFVISHFLRRGLNQAQGNILQASLILNAVGLTACFAYQAVHPEWAFSALMTLGIMHFILAYISRRLERRTSYLVTSTLGAVLIVVAVPFRYTTEGLPLAWLAQCEMFLMTGYRLKDVHFRRLAMVASIILFYHLTIDMVLPWIRNPVYQDVAQGMVLLATGVAFACNMLISDRWFKNLIKTSFERQSLDAYGYAGWALLLFAPLLLLPWRWTIFVWLAIAFLCHEGYRRNKRVNLCTMAHLTMFLVIGRAVLLHAVELYQYRGWNVDAAVLFIVASALYAFSGNSRRRPVDGETPERSKLTALIFKEYSYMAWLLVLGTSWLASSWVWWGLLLSAGSWALHLIGRMLVEKHLLIQAQLTAVIAALWVLSVNLVDGSLVFGVSQRLLVGGTVAALLYGYGEMARRRPAFEDILSVPIHLWVNAPAASLILIFLMWNVLSGATIALGWAVLALFLMEVGRWQGHKDLLWLGHIIATAVFVRLLVANLNAEGQFGWASTRLVTVLPLAAMFYYLFSAMRKDAGGKMAQEETVSGMTTDTYATYGLIALLGVLYFEVSSIWVAVAWAVVSVTVMTVGKIGNIPLFRSQAVILTWVVLARCVFENLYSDDSWRGWNARIVVLGIVAALLLFGFFIARFYRYDTRTKEQEAQLKGIRWALRGCDINAHHFFFFAAAGLITALIWCEASADGYLTAAWALEAFAVFLFAVLLGERPYRLFGMGLLLVCVAKVILMDVWLLQTLPRIIVFIVLGVILVLVSFFYTRYRESWRRLLLE